jgi:hypothetical protein
MYQDYEGIRRFIFGDALRSVRRCRTDSKNKIGSCYLARTVARTTTTA